MNQMHTTNVAQEKGELSVAEVAQAVKEWIQRVLPEATERPDEVLDHRRSLAVGLLRVAASAEHITNLARQTFSTPETTRERVLDYARDIQNPGDRKVDLEFEVNRGAVYPGQVRLAEYLQSRYPDFEIENDILLGINIMPRNADISSSILMIAYTEDKKFDRIMIGISKFG